MQYMLLIYESEAVAAARSKEENEKIFGAYFTYTDALKKAGVMVAGDALEPTTTATTVRKRTGDVVHTDGPFAETKEQFGGYYIIDVPDLDAAMKWAAQCPAAESGSVEVRPVMVFPAD